MASDPTITPPPTDTANTSSVIAEAKTETAPPQVEFSSMRWFFMGLVRVSYRFWTRIAARCFPEGSKAERLAKALHFPLPDKLNMTWVSATLAVGGRVHPADIAALAETGITHVIDTRSEYCDDAQLMEQEQIELLHLPTPDTQPLSIEQMLQGAKWAHERMQQHGLVLIHCEHGVGRSVLLTCAVLVYGGVSARAALELVQKKRWQAAPNHKQVVRLKEFEGALRAERSA